MTAGIFYFTLEEGDITGPYRDLQPHLYSVDSSTANVEQFSKDFPGSVDHYSVTGSEVLAAARLGTEVAMYSVSHPADSLHKLNSWPGTYEKLSTDVHSSRIAFVYSSLQKPAEVYLADSPDHLSQARPFTSFNQVLAEKDLPQGKPYRWTADDGSSIEGMLIYPPGKFEAKNLPISSPSSTAVPPTPTATTSKPTGINGPAWPPPADGSSSNPTTAAPPVTATNFYSRSSHNSSPAPAKISSKAWTPSSKTASLTPLTSPSAVTATVVT